MSDLEGLPLFAVHEVAKPASASCPPPIELHSSTSDEAGIGGSLIAGTAGLSQRTAVIVPFPPCRNIRLVATLACEFINLRAQHGRRSRSILIEKRFKPIRARLRRLKVPTEAICQELACLEQAVARAVWLHDGRGPVDADGGSAA